MILSFHSHVEAVIHAQNVVTGGTLKGSITARTMTEVAEGGRVEGTIRSKALVVGEGALFSDQASIDLQEAPGVVDGSAYPEDELQMGYEQSVRRAAEWYRSSLSEPKAEPDHNGASEPDTTSTWKPDESTPMGTQAASSRRPERIDGSRADENVDLAPSEPERSNPDAKQLVSPAYRRLVATWKPRAGNRCNDEDGWARSPPQGRDSQALKWGKLRGRTRCGRGGRDI